MTDRIRDRIGRDPYFISLAKYQRKKGLHGDTVASNRILIEGRLGNWTGIPNIILECFPIALRKSSSAAAWKIMNYLIREILGRVRNGDSRPKSYKRIINKSDFMKKCCIDGYGSFYLAKKILEDKCIIYFVEDKLYLNMFPLTWNIEIESDKEKIKEIIEREIDRINLRCVEMDDEIQNDI